MNPILPTMAPITYSLEVIPLKIGVIFISVKDTNLSVSSWKKRNRDICFGLGDGFLKIFFTNIIFQ